MGPEQSQTSKPKHLSQLIFTHCVSNQHHSPSYSPKCTRLVASTLMVASLTSHQSHRWPEHLWWPVSLVNTLTSSQSN